MTCASKPNRMIKRFVAEALCTKEEAVGSDFAERLLVEAAATLQNEMPNLSASQLDYQVRLYQRSR